MDEAKRALLLGPGGADGVPDLDDREELLGRLEDEWQALAATLPGVLRMVLVVRVADQIVAEEPPAVWATAQRLLAAGVARHEVVRQLCLALFHPLITTLYDGEDFDEQRYVRRLGWLPVPAADGIVAVARALATAEPGIDLDALAERVAVELGDGDALDLDPGQRADRDQFVAWVVDSALDQQFLDRDGRAPLVLLHPDRVVDGPALLGAGATLTTVVDDAARRTGRLPLYPDLSPLARLAAVEWRGEPVERVDDGAAWVGPPGWLDHLEGCPAVAVRLGDGGEIDLEALPEVPAVGTADLERVRAAYDGVVGEQMPVAVADVALELLLRGDVLSDAPAAPLGTLLVAAGLDVRGPQVAHDDEQWQAEEELDEWLADRTSGRDPLARQVQRRVRAALADEATPDTELRALLDALATPSVARAVVLDVLAPDEAPAPGVPELVARWVAAADRPGRRATARWLAAVVAEAEGDLAAAEAHLAIGHQDEPGNASVTDRLAWYRSDRGDGAGAVRLWRSIGVTADVSAEVAAIEQALAATAGGGAALGRNERCWCGSGRKYKQCHLGELAPAPLADRVSWLYAKAEGYLERSGTEWRSDQIDIAAHLVGPDADRDAVLDAVDHPLVVDLVLEDGAFDEFLEVRGELLPADEQLLAAAWTVASRSVHEVEAVVPGESVRLRDLATGEVVDVRERTFSRSARVGQLLCARVVTDGDAHQLLAGAIHVEPTSVEVLLDLLDQADPYALADWLRDRSRPPGLSTREGEPMVLCRAELDVAALDPDEVRAALDAAYRSDEAMGGDPDVWHELTDVDGDRIVRARLALVGDVLEVEAQSEPRFDRVLATLAEVVPGAVVRSERREPLDVAALSAGRPPGAPPSGGGLSLPPSAVPGAPGVPPAELLEVLEQMEERWCDESVPALGGVTPRQAAADPVGREALVRLIASFPDIDPSGPAMGLRPARLRQLLGLDDAG